MKHSFHIINIVYLIVFFLIFGGGRFIMAGYVMLGIYLFLCFILFPKNAANTFLSKKALPLYLFLIFIFLTGNLEYKYPISLFIMFFPLLNLKFQIEITEEYPLLKKKQSFYLICLYAIIVYFSIQFFIFIKYNPMAARYLVSSKKDESVSIGGGYGLPYALTLLTPYIFYIMHNLKTKSLFKYILLSSSILASYLVIRASYATAIILLILGIGYSFIYKWKTHYKLVIGIFMVLLIVPLFEFVPIIISYVNPEATVLTSRMNEVRAMLNDADYLGQGDFGYRMKLTLSSLKVFLNHILYGVGPIVGYDYYSLWNAGVGSHCEWIDIFARYGLFALLILIFLKTNQSFAAPVHKIVMTMLIILGFLNPVLNYQIMLVAFYIVPLTGYVLNNMGLNY